MEQEKNTKKYWFKPARFWRYFAFYYPVTLVGWAVVYVLIMTLIKIFMVVDKASHSGSGTLISFAPWAIGVLVIFDIFCLTFGEYPSWWRKRK